MVSLEVSISLFERCNLKVSFVCRRNIMSRARPRFRRTNAPLPVPTGNVFMLQLLGTIENQLTINTFYYQDNKVIGTPEANAETNLAQQWVTNVAVNYDSCISADWTSTGIKVTCLTIPSRIPVVYTTGFPSAGTGAAGHMPTEVSCVVQRRTNFKGQSGRGRVGLPAVPLTAVTNSVVNAAQLTKMTAFGNNMILSLVTAGATYSAGLVSRRGTLPNVTYGFAQLISTVNDTLVGTIRRRKIGRGR